MPDLPEFVGFVAEKSGVSKPALVEQDARAFGKAGYGGHDLQRRVFGLSHPYRGEIEEADT
jgi:hypothetical protein